MSKLSSTQSCMLPVSVKHYFHDSLANFFIAGKIGQEKSTIAICNVNSTLIET
jgi:hypothetical protein